MIGDFRELIKIKVARSSMGAIISIKPEYDDLKRLAEKTKKPLRELSELAIVKAQQILSQKK